MSDDRNEQEISDLQVLEERIRRVRTFIEQSMDAELKDLLREMEPEDIAEMLGDFSPEEKLRIFNSLDSEDAAVVLDDTDSQSRLQILQKLDSGDLASILDEMPVDEAADVIEEVPEKDREDILDLMEEKDAEEVEEILSYPADSAARVMNPEFISVGEENDVEDAVRHIRSLEVDEEIFYVYVVDRDMKLRGIVPLRKLLTAPKGTLIKNIMDEEVHAISAGEDREKAAQIIRKYDLSSLPVTDDEGRLVGRITVDDIIDVMEEEHGEDISRMTGTIEEEQGTETTIRATRNRLPWLITCMLGSIITGLVIQMFEVTLAETIALVSFIPAITATGGNSGVQASTVVVREIALGRMDFAKVGEEVWRQLKIATSLGLVCGLVLSVLANIWMSDSKVGIIVGLSIFLAVIWSNFVGVLIPVVFKKLQIDPAISSGPLVTTLNDVVGVFIYLSVATVFLI
ncbi:MAG: magnesium transporter [Candidatus Omnitrophota bacterium]|nr:magnesium transporter [Candidatus Omnitrophota bacterium]